LVNMSQDVEQIVSEKSNEDGEENESAAER
jgi:hypothetical protein